MRMRFVGLTLSAILMAGSLAAAEKEEKKGAAMPSMPAPLVVVNKVGMQFEENVYRYTGSLVSPSTVLVVTRVSGEIIEVGFKDGERVHKGQVLYKLDPVQYYAALKACEARVAQAKSKIEECNAREVYAKSNYDRNRDLRSEDVVSKDTFESVKSAYDVALADSAAAKASLLEAEANLTTAQDNYKHTTIVAAIDGVAGVTNKTLGNYITPSSGTLVTLIQSTPMRACFSVSYNDFMTLFVARKGAVPVIRMRLANGSTYPQEGRLELINNEANQRTDSVKLYAQFDNKEGVLLQGGTVSISLNSKSTEKKIAIAPSAVMHDAGGSYVYVVGAGNVAERRNVKLGLATTSAQFIVSGLAVGETVVVDGMHKVIPGRPVECSDTDAIKK